LIRKNSRILFLYFAVFSLMLWFSASVPAQGDQPIKIILNGKELKTDVPPEIKDGRTMVPIRAIAEGLGMEVAWDEANRTVIIADPSIPAGPGGLTGIDLEGEVSIMGSSQASSEALKAVMKKNNPAAPTELADLYIHIGQIYGVRGDIAFCQAAKETGWWRYGNLVQAEQNNYCGLGATGQAATGNEDLRGADPSKVWFEAGKHGAFFDSPASGVEAHIQHLYAYACNKPLPAGRSLLDPRFVLVSRGIAPNWSDLNGRWACPGVGYGQSILQDYYRQVIEASKV
jgi:hypothetical protein